MKINIHEHYDQLTPREKRAVDDSIQTIFAEFKTQHGTYLAGDDRAEHFADAFAKWVIESRKC